MLPRSVGLTLENHMAGPESVGLGSQPGWWQGHGFAARHDFEL